jgi:hypothetical protein
MSLPESPKPASLPGVKSLILFWVIFGVLGFCGPFTITVISESPYFYRWEKLVTAPSEMDKLLSGNGGQIFITTTAGQILSCDTYKQEQCWIPDINPSKAPYPQPTPAKCNYSSSYFNNLTHPPRNIVDCIEIDIQAAEASTTVLYAIDQQGYFWRWDRGFTNNRMGAVFLAPLSGLIGLLIGSGVWTIRWYLIKRSLSKDQIPVYSRIKSFALWFLVVLPLLLIISIAVLADIMIVDSRRPSAQNDPIFTSVAATLNAESTLNAQSFLTAVTPNPAGPAYDFVAECDSAKWVVENRLVVACSTPYLGMDPFVDVLELQVLDKQAGLSGKALLFNLPGAYSYLLGTYPVWKIQSGDHFRAILGCKGDISQCDVVFSLYLVKQDESRILQGNWEITGDSPSTEIYVDLSRFAGQQVSFQLIANKSNNGEFQSILLVNPLIVNLPEK